MRAKLRPRSLSPRSSRKKRARSRGGNRAHAGRSRVEHREIEAVLFDLDGTLIDTVGLILASMQHATREVLGQELSDSELMCGVGTPLAAQMEALAPGRSDELIAAYRRHNWDVHDDLIAEYPGTEAVLEALRGKGLLMGVVTSKARRVATRGIELFGLEKHFEVIVCSDDLDVHKPDPGPIVHAAGIIGTSVTACAYVGDSPYDMRAAIAADAVGIAALWGAFCEAEVLEPGPPYAIDEIGDLIPLVEGHGSRYLAHDRALGASSCTAPNVQSGTL
jgi:pyrophosphatase PpaX